MSGPNKEGIGPGPEGRAFRRIPVLPDDPLLHPQGRELRTKAPDYLDFLIADGALPNITTIEDMQDIKAFGGGLSACYLFENGNSGLPEFLKFGKYGTAAEVGAYRQWGEDGVSIPTMKAAGVVPSTQGESTPTTYLLLEGVVDQEGKSVPSAGHYIRQHPEEAAAVATLMGEELVKMGKTELDLPIGGFADMKDENAPTISEYYRGKINQLSGFLLKLGVSEDEIAAVQGIIGQTRFPERGVMVHGDYGTHNVLISSESPLAIKVIDPVARIGDPYWDIARARTTSDVLTALEQKSPDNRLLATASSVEQRFQESLLDTYSELTELPLDDRRLLINQIISEFGTMRRHKKTQAQERPVGILATPINVEEEVSVREAVAKGHIRKLIETGQR